MKKPNLTAPGRNKKSLGKETVNRKSSIIFMQLGLVLSLLLVYIAIESKTIVNDMSINTRIAENSFDDLYIPETTHKELILDKPKPEPVLDPTTIDIIDNNDPDETDILFDKEDDPDKALQLVGIDDINEEPIKEEVIEDVPIALVETMPVFPGCKGDKETLQKCLSKKIGKVVQRHFNPDIAQDIGLSVGVQRIFVMFVIDKEGNVTNIQSSAPHIRLKKEVARVLKKIPKMIPGTFKGQNVGVKYSLPINYQVVE